MPRKRRVVLVSVAAALVGGWPVFRPGPDETAADPRPAPTSAPDATRPQPTVVTPTSTTAPVPTVAPNLIGKKLADAQGSVPLKLTSENVIDESKTPGTVVDQDPKAGEPLSGRLKVFVAQKAQQSYLASFEPASGAWNDSDKVAQVAGAEYVHSVGANVSACTETKSVDERIEFGKPAPIDVDLSGVLRVKFQWRPITARSCPNPNTLVLGDAVLLGLPSEVPTSATTPTS